MKIFLNEISDLEKTLRFTQDETWVCSAVLRLDEHLDQSVSSLTTEPRAIDTQFKIRKIDDIYLVSGKINTSLELLCSRCAKSFLFNCHPHFSALFCTDPALAGIAHFEELRPKSPQTLAFQQKTDPLLIPAGRNQGHARHAHNFDDDLTEDSHLESSKDLDITYLSQDFIDLSDVLTEQLQLQIPFQPLCQENCRGICPQCGMDLNHSACTCKSLENVGALAELKRFKLEPALKK
jgi:uncharacterized metal-binding protein YceD (DUF177 family)